MFNPFTPTLGATPPVLTGREEILEDFRRGLLNGPGSPERVTLYSGQRGMGKTVLLGEVAEIAEAEGWITITETGYPGFTERLTTNLLPTVLNGLEPGTASHLTGVSVGPVAANWSAGRARYPVTETLRSQLQRATELLAGHESGVLITLDEVHHSQIGELRELGAVIQHAITEGRDIAFAGAGLPVALDIVTSDAVSTFLRKAERQEVGLLGSVDTARAYSATIENSGRKIGRLALAAAVDAAGGYPFMIQQIGYRAWLTSPDTVEISLSDVENGISLARRRLDQQIIGPLVSDASPTAQRFLAAMSVDEGPSHMSDIMSRLGCNANYASQYRLHLISAGYIAPVARGQVDFVLPYMREHLRGLVAAQSWDNAEAPTVTDAPVQSELQVTHTPLTSRRSRRPRL